MYLVKKFHEEKSFGRKILPHIAWKNFLRMHGYFHSFPALIALISSVNWFFLTITLLLGMHEVTVHIRRIPGEKGKWSFTFSQTKSAH